MSSFVIEGGYGLSGTIRPQGAKNEALEVISATLLTDEEVTISNIPEILDVRNLIILLDHPVSVDCFSNAFDEAHDPWRYIPIDKALVRESLIHCPPS